GLLVLKSPAAMPATLVPWPNSSAGDDSESENALATITFLLVNDGSPRGNPAGAAKPVSENKGLVMSIPESMMAILTPLPAEGPPPTTLQTAGAPMRGTLLSSTA